MKSYFIAGNKFKRSFPKWHKSWSTRTICFCRLLLLLLLLNMVVGWFSFSRNTSRVMNRWIVVMSCCCVIGDDIDRRRRRRGYLLLMLVMFVICMICFHRLSCCFTLIQKKTLKFEIQQFNGLIVIH